MKPRLSVIIITKNEEKNLPECLASARFADQIVVVDSNSTDATPAIASSFGAEVFTHEFQGYGPQKNVALDRANGDWVFSLDADERVPETLRDEICAVMQSPIAADGYQVARRNHVGDEWIRHGGWYPDYVLRLFRREKGRFNERVVHESVHVKGKVAYLPSALLHYPCQDLMDFRARQMRYAQQSAGEMAQSGRRARWTDLHLRPWATFLRMYMLRAGFLDGATGWALARIYKDYTHAKYKELRKLR